MKTAKRECKARDLYSSVVMRAIEDATNRQVGDGTGADEIARWCRSTDGRNILSWAGIEFSERAVALIQECVVEGAKAKRFKARRAHFRNEAA